MLRDLPSNFDDIQAVMGRLPAQGAPVRLVKQYKGLELSQDVRLVEVTPERAALEAIRLNYCTILEGEIHLHSHAFPKPMTARLTDFDYEKGMIFLTDFAFRDWKERQYERVQPREPTYVTVHCRRRDCRAFLEDISLTGAALLMKRDHEHEMRAQPGNRLTLDFELAQLYRFTHVKGIMCYVRPVGEALLKAGIRLFPTMKQARQLQAYIAWRREEILDEVNQSFIKRRAPRGVEALFF